jgi:hypothetical protein
VADDLGASPDPLLCECKVLLPAEKAIGGDVRVNGQGVLDRLVNIEAEMRQEIDLG